MSSRKFVTEGPNLYGKFLQGPVNWAELTCLDDLHEVYSGGFLPFSGDTTDPRHLFYMSRSLRVDTRAFQLAKKRRYDHREWQRLNLARELLAKEAFLDAYGGVMTDLAYQWMEPRFGDASLARDRFLYILKKPFLNHIMAWRERDELVAFALVVSGDWGAHYWYVFYRNGTGMPAAPGHGYLVDFIGWAKSEGLPVVYLGTCYGEKSRYKCRGIGGISFWDGGGWNNDRRELSRLLPEDDNWH